MSRSQREEGSMQIGGRGILKLLPYQDGTLPFEFRWISCLMLTNQCVVNPFLLKGTLCVVIAKVFLMV